MTRHPAISLVLAAEGTPAFHYATERVEAILAVASQTEPDTLPEAWVARLAHRFVDVLLQTEQLDRVQTWLNIAAEKATGAAAAVDQHVLTARLAVRRGALDAADEALSAARRALGGDLDDAERRQRETRVALAAAERHVEGNRFGPLPGLLAPRLETPKAFATLDDLWRAQRLCALAHQMRLDFARAAELYQATVDLCALHEAPLDRADALIRLGQTRLGVGDYPGGLACFRDAHNLAPPRSRLFRDASAALTTGILSSGDLDAAVQVARDAARQSALADDYPGYMGLVGVVTHLLRIGGRHEEAYRQLLGIYGFVLRGLGEEAVKPVLALIDQIRADLGHEAFEALSARMLAQRQG